MSFCVCVCISVVALCVVFAVAYQASVADTHTRTLLKLTESSCSNRKLTAAVLEVVNYFSFAIVIDESPNLRVCIHARVLACLFKIITRRLKNLKLYLLSTVKKNPKKQNESRRQERERLRSGELGERRRLRTAGASVVG